VTSDIDLQSYLDLRQIMMHVAYTRILSIVGMRNQEDCRILYPSMSLLERHWLRSFSAVVGIINGRTVDSYRLLVGRFPAIAC